MFSPGCVERLKVEGTPRDVDEISPSLPSVSTYLRSVKLSKISRYAAQTPTSTYRHTYLAKQPLYPCYIKLKKKRLDIQNARTSNKLFNNLSRKQRGSLIHPHAILHRSILNSQDDATLRWFLFNIMHRVEVLI